MKRRELINDVHYNDVVIFNYKYLEPTVFMIQEVSIVEDDDCCEGAG